VQSHRVLRDGAPYAVMQRLGNANGPFTTGIAMGPVSVPRSDRREIGSFIASAPVQRNISHRFQNLWCPL
jgi:hypothetical protein